MPAARRAATKGWSSSPASSTAATCASMPRARWQPESARTTDSSPPTAAGAATWSTTMAGSGERPGVGRVSGRSGPHVVVAHEGIDEELRRPAEQLVAAVVAAHRERALDPVAHDPAADRAGLELH